MKPTMTLDPREWKKAANELFQTSSRSMVDFINGQSLKVASLALKGTKAATPAKIEAELGAIARRVDFKTLSRGKRKGQTVTRRGGYVMAGADTLAHRILGARKKLTGEFGVKGQTDDERAQNLIKSRVRAANFIRSGWIPVVQFFSSITKVKPPRASTSKFGAKQYGRPKGRGHRAKFSLFGRIEAAIENNALNAKVIPPSKRGHPYKVGVEGLQRALNDSARDMIETLRKRLEPDFKKVSSK